MQPPHICGGLFGVQPAKTIMAVFPSMLSIYLGAETIWQIINIYLNLIPTLQAFSPPPGILLLPSVPPVAAFVCPGRHGEQNKSITLKKKWTIRVCEGGIET